MREGVARGRSRAQRAGCASRRASSGVSRRRPSAVVVAPERLDIRVGRARARRARDHGVPAHDGHSPAIERLRACRNVSGSKSLPMSVPSSEERSMSPDSRFGDCRGCWLTRRARGATRAGVRRRGGVGGVGAQRGGQDRVVKGNSVPGRGQTERGSRQTGLLRRPAPTWARWHSSPRGHSWEFAWACLRPYDHRARPPCRPRASPSRCRQ